MTSQKQTNQNTIKTIKRNKKNLKQFNHQIHQIHNRSQIQPIFNKQKNQKTRKIPLQSKKKLLNKIFFFHRKNIIKPNKS